MHIATARVTANDELGRRSKLRDESRADYRHRGRKKLAAMRRGGYSLGWYGLYALAVDYSYAPNSINQTRTHLRYAIADRLLKRARDADRARRAGRRNAARIARREAERLGDGLAALQQCRSTDFMPNRTRQDQHADRARRVLKPAQRHAAKRDYPDWRVDLLKNAPSGRGWVNAMLVQACSGCRPDEILAGVRVVIQGDALWFRIQGSKTDDHEPARGCGRGQSWRVLTVKAGESGDGLIDTLRRHVVDEGGAIKVSLEDADADDAVDSYCTSVRRLARRLGYKKTAAVSAYSLRHQFAADLKSAGVAGDSLAEALGHATTRSQQVYGLAGLGTGMMQLVSSDAPRPVRYKAPGAIMRADAAGDDDDAPAPAPAPG